MIRFNDTWLRLTGITLLMLVSLSVNDYLHLPFTWKIPVRILISFIAIAGTWQVNRLIIFRLRERFPGRKQIFKRLFFNFFIGVTANMLFLWPTGIAHFWLIHGSLEGFTKETHAVFTFNNHQISLWFYGADLVQAITIFLFFWIMYESIFFVVDSLNITKRLQKAEHEKAILEKVNLQSQLEALKQQVNPHFLFNSLNALGTLIEEDPKQASVFLEELSTVYRYLLRSNDQNLITLAAELEFIHSYMHLLKTRYGLGLNWVINVDTVHKNYQIPPLTLQLLVENAVKHNIILPEEPLTITIYTNPLHQLVITNNLQRKNARIHSNGVGLNNILTKYKMLGQTLPTVHENETQFAVFLPLIE